jgi:hypothetical protein
MQVSILLFFLSCSPLVFIVFRDCLVFEKAVPLQPILEYSKLNSFEREKLGVEKQLI